MLQKIDFPRGLALFFAFVLVINFLTMAFTASWIALLWTLLLWPIFFHRIHSTLRQEALCPSCSLHLHGASFCWRCGWNYPPVMSYWERAPLFEEERRYLEEKG